MGIAAWVPRTLCSVRECTEDQFTKLLLASGGARPDLTAIPTKRESDKLMQFCKGVTNFVIDGLASQHKWDKVPPAIRDKLHRGAIANSFFTNFLRPIHHKNKQIQ